ncbi:hypothetical protein KCP73_01375 [Salmonella enterica subsp. enterica]|nr:hypothetical protein KCP73_01375 [Salmonella enterica subsp. enterica]
MPRAKGKARAGRSPMTKRPVNAGRFVMKKKSRRAATCSYGYAGIGGIP